jgi:segregation and condensation protein B
MSLKAKLEAVIYAAEEPVTLTQLAALFAGDALEWKAAQLAAAAEQTAEVAGVDPADPLPLLPAGLEYLGLADTPEVYASEAAVAAAMHTQAVIDSGASEATPPSAAEPAATDPAAEAASEEVPGPEAPGPDVPGPGNPADPETEARRLSRLRDREIKGALKQILDELIAEYASDSRGVEIREIAGGYRMATKPECHDAVRMFVKSLKPPMKLSLPALETLAVVAYKQPVTSPEVSEIRGVESGGVLGSLLARKLIATAGRKQVIGRPILYKTTKEFLLRFGLKDLAELPSMEEFEKMAAAEIEELEPEVVAADAAETAAELAENSPSGQEMADAATELEGESAEPPAENQVTISESEEAVDSASPAPSHEPESAADSPFEAAGAAPESSAGNHVPSAEPHQETETVPHAEEDEENR